jgi:2'-5' RNA ligase
MAAEAVASKERRVFFALWPDEAVLNQLEQAGREAHRHCGGRRMRVETLHLTLAFIGSILLQRISELESIAGAVRAPAFELALDYLQCVPGRKIVWAGASEIPGALRDLAADLGTRLKAAGFRTEERPFAAHVTLLRNARCEETQPEAPRIAWRVDEFVLVESELKPAGASYRIIGRWPLTR